MARCCYSAGRTPAERRHGDAQRNEHRRLLATAAARAPQRRHSRLQGERSRPRGAHTAGPAFSYALVCQFSLMLGDRTTSKNRTSAYHLT